MMLPVRAKIYVANVSVDFRKTFDGLCGVVREVLLKDPQSPSLFVFRNKRGDQVRILWWDRNGYALWMKRLERGVFQFPCDRAEISSVELATLLEGAVCLRSAA